MFFPFVSWTTIMLCTSFHAKMPKLFSGRHFRTRFRIRLDTAYFIEKIIAK